MRTVDLQQEPLDLNTVITLSRDGPVLLLTTDGRELVVSEADDFQQEVESLRANPAFQRFLDRRSACTSRVPLEELERELSQGAE